MADLRNAHRILVGMEESAKKKRRWVDNIKADVKMVGRFYVHYIQLNWYSVNSGVIIRIS
jgi:hypothetical protein